MSKDLEFEYKKMMNDQIPDLWSRIEAGLDREDRARPSAEPAVSAVPSGSSVRKRRRTWQFAAGIAAAACVCLIVPLALSMGSGAGSKESMSMTAEALPEEAAAAAGNAGGTARKAVSMEDAVEYEEASQPGEAAGELYAEAVPEEAAEAFADEEYAIGNEILYEQEAAAAAEAPEEAYAEAREADAAEAYAEAGEADAAEAYAEAEETDTAKAKAGETDAAEAAPVILSDVEYKIDEISEEDLSAGRLTAQILSCPGDRSLEGTYVTIIKARGEILSAAGLSGAPELPDAPGTYAGSLAADTASGGVSVYALIAE